MSSRYTTLPQLDGGLFLTDAGLETDLIFNKGIEIDEFAAHTLLPDARGRAAITEYLRGFADLASKHNAGLILDAPTWKAHSHWAADLKTTPAALRKVNHAAIAFISELRAEYEDSARPIVLNAVVGPCGDAYAPEDRLSTAAAKHYHAEQLGWLAETDVDMVSALTFTQTDEAAGFVQAANALDLPVIVSFTLETDGRLPTGDTLADAIASVDAQTDGGPAYYMVNCAHPTHMQPAFDGGAWQRRIRGLRCNASKLSHAELDECETLDRGDVDELAAQYVEFAKAIPSLNVFGGCCGTDLEHVSAIAERVYNA